MAATEWWRLIVYMQGGEPMSIIGDELEFREIQARFCAGEAFGKVSISGITDTADRAPLILAIDFESVTCITLVKLYG